MKKWFKRGLFTLVVLVIVALVGAAVFLLTFDPNAYKNKVEQLVYERYQRHLTIEGDIELSLFPRIGLAVEHVSLSNHNNESTFASVDSARFAIAVWPLLWNRLVVDHVAVSGFKVWVQRDNAGNFNFSDLLRKPAPLTKQASSSLSPIPPAQAKTPSLVPDATQAEFQIDIAGLDLKEGEIHFYDQDTTTQMRLVNLELNTGRMTFAQPFDVIFKGNLQGEQPIAQATLEGQALVQLEPHLHRYSAQKINMNLVGKVGAYTAQSATLRGALEALTHTEDLRARQLELVTQGKWQDETQELQKIQVNLNAAQLNLKRNLQLLHTQKMQLRASAFLPVSEGAVEHKLELAFDAPKVNVDTEQVSADPVAFSFKQNQGQHMFGINIRSKQLEGSLDQFTAQGLQIDVAGKDGQRAWKLDMLSALTWAQSSKTLFWSDLVANLVLEDENLAPNPAQAKLTGAGSWAIPEQHLAFEGQWQSANTQAVVQSTLTHEQNWLLQLDVNANELDFNPWLRQPGASSKPASAATPSVQTKLLPSYFDWAGLHTKLTLQAEALRYRHLQAQNVTAQLEQRDRAWHLLPSTAQVWGGAAQAEGSWRHSDGHAQLRAAAKDIDLAAFTEQLSPRLRLSGQGDLKADLSTHGFTPLARRAYLDGTLDLNATSGQLIGWNPWQTLEQSHDAVRNVFSGQVIRPTEHTDAQSSTAFNALQLALEWQQGQALIKKGLLQADGLTLNTQVPSYFDTVNQQLDVALQLQLDAKALPETKQRLHELSSHPFYVRLSGAWQQPLVRVQWQRLEQPIITDAMDHGLLSLLGRPDPNGMPLGLKEAAPAPELKTLGDTLKSLLKN